MAGGEGVHRHVVCGSDFVLLSLNELGQIGQAAAVEETGGARGSDIGRGRGVGIVGRFSLLGGRRLLHGRRASLRAGAASNGRMERRKQPMPRGKTTPALEERPQEQESAGDGRVTGNGGVMGRRGLSI